MCSGSRDAVKTGMASGRRYNVIEKRAQGTIRIALISQRTSGTAELGVMLRAPKQNSCGVAFDPVGTEIGYMGAIADSRSWRIRTTMVGFPRFECFDPPCLTLN